MIELSAESDTPLHATHRAFIPRGALAAACFAGMAIGTTEWLLGEPSEGLASLIWTTALYTVLSAMVAVASIGASRFSPFWNPVWLWTWFWVGAYGVIYSNLLILPLQSFLTPPSIGLSLVVFSLAGMAAWALAGVFRRPSCAVRTLHYPRRRAHAAELLTVLAALGIVTLLPATRPSLDLSAPHIPRKPGELNALVVLIDTLRADHVSAYGYGRRTTPRIDSLAAEGVRFDVAYSPSSWTAPAVASLFSGQPVSRHRCSSLRTRFDFEPTLAETLSAAGLVTAGFSSNPLVSELYGFERGFDTFVSYRSAVAHPLRHLCAGTSRTVLAWLMGLDRAVSARSGVDWDQTLVEKTKQWLQRHKSDRFFVYVHLLAPHASYAPPPAFREAWVDSAYHGVEHESAEGAEMLEPDELRNVVQRYDAEIAYADSLVGLILDYLAQLELIDSTAVFVTSDHGEAFGEHGYWEHGKALYTEEARVPLVARVPGRPSGLIVRDPVSMRDLHATILDLVGAGEPATNNSESLMTMIAGTPSLSVRPVISELLQDGGRHPETFQAVTLGDLRLIHNVTLGKMELFDRSSDPAESRPLENQAVASMLEAYFAPRWWESTEGVAAHRMTLTDEDIGRLRSLGYIR